MIIRLRQAFKRDLEAIKRINDEVQGNPWTSTSIDAELENTQGSQWVAVDHDDNAVGYAFTREGCESIDVLMIGVDSRLQRQGVGRKLLDAILKQVDGGKDLFLEVSSRNEGAIRFYEALGFKTYLVRRNYYRDNSDAYCMKLESINR